MFRARGFLAWLLGLTLLAGTGNAMAYLATTGPTAMHSCLV